MLVFIFPLFYQTHKYRLIFDTVILQFQSAVLIICPTAKIQNLFIVAAFSNNYFSGKTSLLVKNLYLITFPDDKAEILVVCLSKLY